MPGPCNSKKKRKQSTGKGKVQTKISVLKEVEQNVLGSKDVPVDELKDAEDRTRFPVFGTVEGYSEASLDPETRLTDGNSQKCGPQAERTSPVLSRDFEPRIDDASLILPHLENPFITDPGNGPRVKNAEAFLTSFFCPPLSLEEETCAAFAREEVLTVLEAVLPREVALIVWYNKTRKYGRICPACQRLYRLGDALVDPINGEPVDVYDSRTPPQVLREQQLSGICSMPCFLLASYTSHPYVTEVARGAWGRLTDELDAQTRSLLDATDPQTAALLRYGLEAWAPSQGLELGEMTHATEDQGLGRIMRLTRRLDLGLGEVLEALAWHEGEKRKEREDEVKMEGRIAETELEETASTGRIGEEGEKWGDGEQPMSSFSPTLSAPKGIRT